MKMTPTTASRTARALLLSALTLASAPALAPADAHAQEWDVRGGDARTQEIVRRYLQILEQNPVEGFILNKLLETTGKGGGLDRLITDYQAKVKANPDTLKFQLILGHLLKAKARYEEAYEVYSAAIALSADNAAAHLGRGHAAMMLQRDDQAEADFERALTLEKDRDKKQEVLRKLADLAFNKRDWDRAQRYYDELIKLAPRDEYLRMEYAQVLVKYKRYDQALAQYEALVKLAGRDVKARTTTLRDMGELYELMGDDEQALKTYQQAMRDVRSTNWLYRELEQRILGVYRRGDKLAQYAEERSKAWRSPSFDQAMLLASVYDELGDEEQALKLYKIASSRDSRNVDPRQRIIQILQRRGDFKGVIAGYEALTRVAPRESRFQFELAKIHARNGDNKKAEAVLRGVRSRFSRDPEVLVTLADTYMRLAMREQALAIYKDLVRIEPRNDSFIISLGEYYYQEGSVDQALETWRKILKADLGKAEALARLGQVLVDHNMVDRGLSYYQQARDIAPDDQDILYGYAIALESARQWDEAIATWERVLALANQPAAASEARQRIVGLYRRQNRLRTIMREYEERFAKDPKDANTGLLLAEAYTKQGDLEAAERIFRQLIDADGVRDQADIDALTALERVLAQQGKAEASITILQELAELRPLRAKEYYYRIAELSLKSFEDDQAVRFAKLAIEKSPDDATSHARLGAVYARMQRTDEAVSAYKIALDLDPRALEHAMALAELLLSRGQRDEAAKLYRRVTEQSSDDGLSLIAARKALSLATTADQLAALEAELAPLVFRSPPRPIFRKIMLELYGRLLSPLVVQRDYGAAGAEQAATQLDALGQRAFPVLMDALQSEDIGQRQQAARLIGDLRLGNAALALARIVEDKRDPLRFQAAMAVARLGDARAAAPLVRVLQDDTLVMRQLAAWALGSAPDPVAIKALSELLETGSGSLQAIAALSLGRIGSPKAAPALRAALARSASQRYVDESATAITWALGRLRDPAHAPALIEVLSMGGPQAQQAAAWGLAQLDTPEATRALLEVYWGDDAPRRRVARAALTRAVARVARGSAAAPADERDALLSQLNREAQFVDTRGQSFRSSDLLRSLNEGLASSTMADPSAWIMRHEAVISALLQEVAADPARRAPMLSDLAEDQVTLGLGESSQTPPELQQRRAAWMSALSSALAEASASADTTEAVAALRLIALGGAPATLDAALSAARADEIAVRQQAALTLGRGFSDDTRAQAALRSALDDPHYLVRASAARALHTAPLAKPSAPRLIALLEDPYALVQIESARALGRASHAPALKPLSALLSEPGAEVAVRVAALEALVALDTPEARALVAPYRDHADLRLRHATRGGEGAATD